MSVFEAVKRVVKAGGEEAQGNQRLSDATECRDRAADHFSKGNFWRGLLYGLAAGANHSRGMDHYERRNRILRGDE